MKILNAKYLDDKKDGVLLTFEDTSTFQIPTQKERYQYTDLFNEFIKDGGVIEDFKTLNEKVKESRENKINDLKTIYTQESNSNIIYKNITYKGGEASASAIAGAVTLAQSLQETEVIIIDSNDEENILTFDEALELSSLLAKSWRESFFKYKELKRQVSIVATVKELDQIKW